MQVKPFLLLLGDEFSSYAVAPRAFGVGVDDALSWDLGVSPLGELAFLVTEKALHCASQQEFPNWPSQQNSKTGACLGRGSRSDQLPVVKQYRNTMPAQMTMEDARDTTAFTQDG